MRSLFEWCEEGLITKDEEKMLDIFDGISM
jgi:hypothetical protein